MAAKKKSKEVPQWYPAPEELIYKFENAVNRLQGVQIQKLFGYPCSFVNGYMFAGLHQDEMFLRLSDEDRSIFLEFEDARHLEAKPGQVLREYIIVPKTIMKSENQLNVWLKKAFIYAKSLPPKKADEKISQDFEGQDTL